MPIKRRLQHLKAARAASVESFKKRRLEASSLPNSARLQIDNDKLSTGDTSDTDGESGIWFWNESANETNSDSKKKMRVMLMEMIGKKSSLGQNKPLVLNLLRLR